MSVSWLRLEQYRLGELGPEQAAEVEAAIQRDPEARARWQAIEADQRPLPALVVGEDSGLPLPAWDVGEGLPRRAESEDRPRRGEGEGLPGRGDGEDLPRRGEGVRLAERGVVVPLRRWGAPLAALAAMAAAALLFVRPAVEPVPSAALHYKGGDLALDLDRARDGTVQRHATAFQPGDRFQVRLTCPPGQRQWRVRVFQAGEATEPIGAGSTACGNGLVLPGAFALDGDAPATVCVGVDEGAAALAVASAPPHAEGVVCQVLAPL